MAFSSWVRRAGFWTCDRLLLHGEFRRNYLEARNAYISGTDMHRTKEKIEKILEHAVKTTKFYAQYEGVKELKDFPIVNKINYQEKWDDFVSSEYADDKKCHLHYTSGSTGTPLKVLYDQGKGRRRNGVSIFLNSLVDYRIGDRQAYLRIWTDQIRKGRMAAKMMNLLQLDTSNMDDKHLEEICNILAKKHVRAIAGYASSLTILSRFIEENHIDCSKFSVQSITPTSEALPVYIREDLRRQFSCTVSSIYGAEEFGTIGIQMKDSDEYYLDTSGVFLEVLKLEQDVPAKDGELGRLVITDLHNYAFPLIRYENGDVVIRRTVRNKDGRYKQYFTQIYGRKTDLIYDTQGKPVSPHFISMKMRESVGSSVAQWKFVQTGPATYRFVINGEKEKTDEKKISGWSMEALGMDAEISFEYVKEIPVLKSGKRKYIENQYYV